MNKILVVFVCASLHCGEAYSWDQLSKDAPDYHSVLWRVLKTENVRKNQLAKVSGMLSIEDQESDNNFYEFQNRLMQFFGSGLVLEQ